MPDMMVETKDPSKKNVIERYRDMGDGSHARQIYAVNSVEMRPLSSQITATSFNDLTQAGLMTKVNNHLAASTKRFVSLNQYAGGLVTLVFYATVIEMPNT